MSGLSWGEMGGEPCVTAWPEVSREYKVLEVRACACPSFRIAGGGRAKIDSISVAWEPFISKAVRSEEPVGVGGGFGLGIADPGSTRQLIEDPRDKVKAAEPRATVRKGRE